jgi:NAD-dependent dihydropyrimidine dehydrogenase PreA subunit
MSTKSEQEFIENFKTNFEKEPIFVYHEDLIRCGDSAFKSNCPMCEDGVLLIQRDTTTFNLKKEDNCISCGRRFIYGDISGNNIGLEY